jgi:hypothetical protein
VNGVRGGDGAVVGLLGALVAELRRDLGRLVGSPSIAFSGVPPDGRVLLT